MKKMKVKVNDLGKVYLLEDFGQITYVDKMVKVVFILLEEKNIENVKELPFVLRVTESRNGTLLAV
ncbi:DUF2129 domain-containing protein [Mesobacillus subterraneus]|uniref:DUF2129 domain-containing protein n=1 Tax=Mesobacillus subterraneus TaxID=285983 RepID=UPI00203BC8DA|nr:DUF2129 domain-containing protein [Mesobacillus subterraneus]MCM3667161.1 DUF2129 domain-containing protein [Mesobacillus subterraneus]MCM3685972.1 DUF2129 domain-containing protein [Mesobacillus subterraneus]